MTKLWPYIIRFEYKIPQNVPIPHSSLLQAIAEDINPLATMLTKNTAVSFVALAAPLLVMAVASMAAIACNAQQSGPNMTDIESGLLSGLRASDHYVVGYVPKQSFQG